VAKRIIFAVIAILIIIQFIKPDKNIHTGKQINAIETKYSVSDSVKYILAIACNDCHSNNTRYPWYNNIQPIAWWLDSHITDGKKHLNFDDFTSYSLKRQDHKLEELIESQKDHWMPLESFTVLHEESRLTKKQSKLLINWANETRKVIQADSLFTAPPPLK
jgi:hypothetical protein